MWGDQLNDLSPSSSFIDLVSHFAHGRGEGSVHKELLGGTKHLGVAQRAKLDQAESGSRGVFGNG
jgi:hypothetical protein